MKLSPLVATVTIVVFSIALGSCSTTSEVANTSEDVQQEESSPYPEWYAAGQSFAPDSLEFRGYATALAGDSAGAVDKAVTQARHELKSGISRRLESIRKQAVEELGQNSGLGSSGFIITLRNAEKSIPDAAGMANTEVEPNEAYKGFRAFAEVTVERKTLLSTLDRAMSRYRTAWNRMKDSQAFSEF